MRYEAYVCRRIDAVIAVCTLNRENYFENRAKSILFIANYPLLSEFPRPTRNTGMKNSLCYIGGLTENRGITNLVIAADIAEATLFLAGKFSPSQYEEELRGLPHWKCVKYEGVLNRQQIYDLLSSCTVGLCILLDKGQ